MVEFEKLGAFYLGKSYDLQQGRPSPDLVLYDSRDLTTHAVIVGMTGSGKTGLGIALLEEAAIDGIPALVIDPKGDLGNLLLTFPDLAGDDFLPWTDPGEAARSGMSRDEHAANTAARWKRGLAEWGQEPERIARFASAAERAIYTPGSDAGLPLSILRSFDAPSAAVRESDDALRERVSAAVSGLLTLLGIEADPLRSREHILLSNILDGAWKAGRNLDLAGLISAIQNPEFDRVGVIDLETFYPAQDRFALAMTINSLLASPAFAAWTQGEPLDVQRLLYTAEGRPRLAIISIAHLPERERMFFITLLLNEVISWMRAQAGTSSLRAILYMDEVFGYLPPTQNPPSKLPLLTLLKQARAYGLGLVLATQNPVDLDYKALSNAGTWLLGRLQTERDKLRVIDGLEGASATAGRQFDRQRIEAILSGLGQRVFLMNNVHEDEPVVFQTRWVLSYLRGPLTREQIQTLMDGRKPVVAASASSGVTTRSHPETLPAGADAAGEPPVIPPGVRQLFAEIQDGMQEGRILLRPAVLGAAKLHFVDSKAKIDVWRDVVRIRPITDAVPDDLWEGAESLADGQVELSDSPPRDLPFGRPAVELTRPKSYERWARDLKNTLYRDDRLPLWHCPSLKMYSQPDEPEGDFRVRLRQVLHERRDAEVEKLRKKYAAKIATLQDRIRRAEQRVEVEREQAQGATWSAALSFGSSLVGALLGRKTFSRTNVSRAATSMRSAGRAANQRSDIGRAEENVRALQNDLEQLETELQQQIDELAASLSHEQLVLEPHEVRPRKSDIAVEQVALLWLPWCVDALGVAEPAYNDGSPLA